MRVKQALVEINTVRPFRKMLSIALYPKLPDKHLDIRFNIHVQVIIQSPNARVGLHGSPSSPSLSTSPTSLDAPKALLLSEIVRDDVLNGAHVMSRLSGRQKHKSVSRQNPTVPVPSGIVKSADTHLM